MTEPRTAKLTRMVLPDHECPFGVRAKAMLEQAGFAIDEHLLESRAAVDAFKAKHDLATTPLIEIDGRKIGGSNDLEAYLATTSKDDIAGDAGGSANVSSGGGSGSSAIGR